MDMETKTYYAEDMPTAMEQIKRELGVDAIIVKSRKIRQKYGPLGLFRRDMYEVVVSCEPDKSLPPARAAFNMDARLKQAKAQERREAARREEARPKKADPMPSVEELLPRKTPMPPVEELLPRRESARPQAREAGEDPINIKSIQPERFAQLLELNASRQEAAEEQEDMLRALSGSRANEQPAAVSSSAKLGAYAAAMPERPARFIRPAREELNEEPKAAPAAKADAAVPAPPRKRGRPRKQPAVQPPEEAAPEPFQEAQEDETMARLAALEAMMRELHDKMMEETPRHVKKAKPAKKKSEQEETLESLMEALADQDVDSAAIKAIEEDAKARMAQDKLDAQEAVRQALVELLGKPRCMRASSKKRPRCILFVGPTGVGKTTTLVKLASTCVFERSAKVAIINADVFRVGAQDQLSAYARILNVPVSTIYDSGEIATAVEAYRDHDFVFIDTSGKAPHDPDYQAELKKLIELGSISEIYLTASSTSSGRVCRQLAREYEGLGDYRIIVTKLDESGSYGSLVNLRHASGRPLSYITTGQNVPDDIKRAEPEDIVSELLG